MSRVTTWVYQLVALAFAAGVGAICLPPSLTSGDAEAGAPPPVELAGKRTPTSKTFQNANGSFTTSVYETPIHYRDRTGALKEISSKVVGDATEPGYAWRNDANSFDVRFKPRLNERFMRFRTDGRVFGLTLEGAAATTATTSGSRLVYRDAFPDVDLRYDLMPSGVKETLVLNEATAPLRYRFSLEMPARVPVTTKRLHGGAWAFNAPGHAGPIFVLAPPNIGEAGRGAALRQSQRAPSSAVSMDVRRAGDHFEIELAVSDEWLQAPGRSFPVLLDPTIVLQPSAQDGNWDIRCGNCTGYAGSPLWMGGDEYSRWRAAVKFDLADVPPGATVNSASLSLWNDADSCIWTSSGACSTANHTLNVHRMTTAWDGWDSTWNQVGWDSAVVTASTTVSGSAPSGWMSWNVKTQVANWVSGTQANHGFLLKRATDALNSGGPGALAGDAADPTQAPKLEVNYTSDAVKLYKPETLHGNGADLRWSPYAYPDGHAFQKSEIHRSSTANFTASAATLVATIGDPAVTAYRDTTAAPSKTFTYKIVTNGWPSNEQTVSLPADGQATKTIQLGPESRATYLEYMTGEPNCFNFGADEWMYVGRDTDEWTPRTDWFYRPLIGFDLRDIPAGSTVTNATLSLYTDFMPPSNTVTVNAHRVTSAWKEGTGLAECTGDGASWLESEGGVKWTSPGGDYDPTVLSSVSHGPNDLAGTWDNFTVTSAVQKWVNSDAPNHGLLLKLAAETPTQMSDWFAYMTDDATEESQRPKLALTYSDGSAVQKPTTSVASPAPAELVSGSAVTIAGAASDDGRVSKVEFLVDGALQTTDTTAPYSATWNTTTATNAAHTLKTRATDDAGNVTESGGTSVTVENSATPATSVTVPTASATVSGTAVNVTATASGGRPISKVEFFVDGLRFAEDTTSPYSVPWNTLDATQPAYDGAHTLSTKAYDSVGRTASSTDTSVTVANTTSTKFKAGFSSTEFPQAVIYDPASATQDKSGLDVTVTNNSTVTWLASDAVLKYRWYSPDATPIVTDGPEVSLGNDLPAGQARVLRVMADPPVLPDGVNKAQYKLRVDMYSKTNAAWFADKGNKPLENPVIVNKALVRGALGFEPYYHFTGEELGAGMRHDVNVANGNSIVRWTPFSAPGRGLDTVLTLTHNALEKKCECPGGNNWSLSISGLTRFGNPIDVHPNKADEIAGRSNKYIEYTDSDGTTHRFTSSDGITYHEPAGVHLFLRRYSTTDTARKWALTTPDRVTYFYDVDGFPTSVEDRNGNRITFTLQDTPPAEDPGGPKRRITKVTDAGGRDFTITYWVKADKVKSHVRGKIRRITDHSGSPLDFEYYEDGNLRKLIQRGGTNADGAFLADRWFVFTYTTSAGDGPAIPLAANRVDPDARTPNQSTRLYSIRDPRGAETLFSYLGPGNGEDRWKLASRTDRGTAVTTYAYDVVNRVTTVNLPAARTWKYGYDVEGKATSVTNPLNQVTTQAWSGDRMLTKVTEATGAYVEFAYNGNGVKTDQWDQLRNRTIYEYENLAVDALDVASGWKAGRTIPHLSRLKTITQPRGTATATPTNDFMTSYSYDTAGNITRVTDALGNATAFAYNADGTLGSETDANGRVTTYAAYDANGLATRVIDAASKATTFGYDVDGRLLWTQDPLHEASSGANSREYRTYLDYDSFGRHGRTSEPKSTSQELGVLVSTTTAYDANDNVVAQHAPSYGGLGAKTTITYDPMDRMTLTTGPDTSVDPAGEQTRNEYDAAGRVVRITDPKGVATATANDYATSFSYDGVDRLTTTTQHALDSAGAVTRTLKTHYCYDVAGDLRWTVAPNAGLASVDCSAQTPPRFTTRRTYDAAHRELTVEDPMGNRASVTYDANGNLATDTDAAGATRTFVRDQRDALVKTIHPFDVRNGVERTFTTVYEYDGVGNLKREVSPRGWDVSTDKTTFTQFVTSFVYDPLDRLVRVDLPTSAAHTQTHYIHRGYDANGNLTLYTLPAASADPAGVAPEKKATVSYFDTGWPRTSKTPHQPKLHYDYAPDGSQTSRAPETATGEIDTTRRETWTYAVDYLLTAMKDAAGQSSTYSYDANGNVIAINEGRGLTGSRPGMEVRLSYNGLDETARVRSRELGEANYRFTALTYDDNGNVVERAEDGVETPAGSVVSAGRRRTIAYDDAGLPTTQIDYGRTTSASDDARLSMAYLPTGLDRSVTLERSDGAGGWRAALTTTREYFADGSVKTQVTKNGLGTTVESHTLAYEDTAGKYLNGLLARDTFTAAGGTGPCRTSSCTVSYGYDSRDRLVEESRTRNEVVKTTSFGLDTTGNVTRVDDAGTVTTYAYSGDQLVSRTRGSETRKYFWDGNGNLDCITKEAGSREDCATAQGTTPSPNLIGDFTYDYLDRLWGLRSFRPDGTNDKTASYGYDALSRVSSQTEAHGAGAPRTTELAYVGTTPQIDQETVKSGAGTVATNAFSYDAEGRALDLTRTPTGGAAARRDYAYDARGNVSMLVGSAGAADISYGYGAYGGLDAELSSGDPDATNPLNTLRFSGKRFDSGSATVDMGARRFDTDDLRFLQQDRLAASADDIALTTTEVTQNRYALAGADPVNYRERDGHAPVQTRDPNYPGGATHADAVWCFNHVRKCIGVQAIAGRAYDAMRQLQRRGSLSRRLCENTADAYRHCLWIGWVGLRYGQETAKVVGFNHEWHGRTIGCKGVLETAQHLRQSVTMDLHNNAVGRRFACEIAGPRGGHDSQRNVQRLAQRCLNATYPRGGPRLWVLGQRHPYRLHLAAGPDRLGRRVSQATAFKYLAQFLVYMYENQDEYDSVPVIFR